MANTKKRITALALSAALLSGSVSAFAAPDVSFKKNADGTATGEITGVSNVDKVVVAQYDPAGKLVNFGMSNVGGTSATTRDTFDWGAEYNTKITAFTDWSNLSANDNYSYRLGTRTYANEDFNNHATKFLLYEGGHVMAMTDGVGVDGTDGLLFKSNANVTNGGHATISSLLSPISDFMVYEFDIKLNSAATYMSTYIRAVNSEGSEDGVHRILDMTPGNAGDTSLALKLGTSNYTMNIGEWYNVVTVVNYKNNRVKITATDADGEVTTVTEALTSGIGYDAGEAKPCTFRFHTGGSSSNPAKHDFVVDNVRIYEGTQSNETLNERYYTVETDNVPTVFESEDNEKATLSGTYSLHTRSGIAYNGTSKTELKKKPYIENDIIYVNIAELAQAWGVTISGVATDGSGYGKLSDVATALGKNLYVDSDTQYNNGLCVVASGFTFPTKQADLQKLNDFVYYLRPTEEQIIDAYNASATKGDHPRIMATEADFARVKAEYLEGDNPVFMSWAQSIISQADVMLTYQKGDSNYEARWGYNLADGYITTATEWNPKAMFTWAMAYHLTENEAYLDKMYEVLEYIAEYPDWCPIHHLAPPRIALGYIIAYDWCYDAWTPEQREFLEQTMYEKFYYEVAQAYQSGGSSLNNAATATNNHNVVFNSGVAMAAMAFMEAYPEESTYLLENAIRSSDIMWWHWAPSGSWYEGLSYWELTMEYTVYMLSSLESTFGTTFGLETMEGLSDASEFTIHSQTQNGPHNYSDCTADHQTIGLYTPEMLWLSEKFDNPGITQAVIKYNPTNLKNTIDDALGLLWYDADITSTDVNLPYDVIYETDDVVMMRNTWEQNGTTSFVGIHGGYTNIEHSQLDGGSYVFEQGGIRWAIDPGLDNYHVPSYFLTTYSETTTNRWRYWRSTVGAHNTVEIEPSVAYTGHDLKSKVEVKLVESGENGAIATADMSEALTRHASKATRGFYYTDNRQSLVIRDEISLRSGEAMSYYANDNFDGKTTTDVLGTNATYEIVDGTNAGLSADDKLLSLTPGTDSTTSVPGSYFNGTNWNDNTGYKQATIEFDYYTTNTWDDFYFYPTGSNRYGIRIKAGGDNAVMGLTPGWAENSTGVTAPRYEWHHFAMEYDMTASTFKIYKDNTVIYETTGLVMTDSVPADFQLRASNNNGRTYINNLKFYEGLKGADIPDPDAPAEEFDVYWYLVTGEDTDDHWGNLIVQYIDVEVDEDTNSAILTHRRTGKKMKLEYVVTGGTAEISTINCETLKEQLIDDGFLVDTSVLDSYNQTKDDSHKNRITIKVTGSGDITITAKLTPVGLEGATPITDYTGPISTWSL